LFYVLRKVRDPLIVHAGHGSGIRSHRFKVPASECDWFDGDCA